MESGAFKDLGWISDVIPSHFPLSEKERLLK